MGIPNRLIDLLRPDGSRRFCPGGVGDHGSVNCRYCLTEKGMNCACCPLLSEMLPHHGPEPERATRDVATDGTAVRGRAGTDMRPGFRRFGWSGTRIRKAWLPAARIAPAFDHRLLSLLAIAVVPGFWVWPLRGHIRTATVSVCALLRRPKGSRKNIA